MWIRRLPCLLWAKNVEAVLRQTPATVPAAIRWLATTPFFFYFETEIRDAENPDSRGSADCLKTYPLWNKDLKCRQKSLLCE